MGNCQLAAPLLGSPPRLWHRMIGRCRCCQMAFDSKGAHLRSIHDSSVPCNTGIKRASGAQRKELSRPEEVRVAFLKSNIRPQSQKVHSSFGRRGRRWARMPQAEGPTGTKHRSKQEEVFLLATVSGESHRCLAVWGQGH